jgi:uncharacterized protein YkwD
MALVCLTLSNAMASAQQTAPRGVERLATRSASPDTIVNRGASSTSRSERSATFAHETDSDADPYGFVSILNAYRASAGLPPVSSDENLSAWASHNNAAQCRKGIGHHINPNCFQNCGWNYASAWDVTQGWMNSPGHRRNMLSPWITRVGIAYGPGPYWTMNAR